MLENHSDKSIIGDRTAPVLTHYAATYGYAANYYGVTHPSLPNYIAITSGSNWFSNSDDPNQRFDHANIVDELEKHHISWRAYMQALPYPGYGGNFYPPLEVKAAYVIRHDPFMLYDDVRNSPSRRGHIVPLAQLSTDIAGRLPQFMWISPDICKDMHGTPEEPCPYARDAQLRRSGDDFVAQWVPRIMHATSWTKNSVVFILTDETSYNGDKTTGGWLSTAGCCDSPKLQPGAPMLPKGGIYGGGRIPLIVIGGTVRPGYRSSAPYNHYSLLRTVEDAWGLAELGMTSDDRAVRSLGEFFFAKPVL